MHSAILSTFIRLPFVIKIFVLSIFEWPFYTGFTVVYLGQRIRFWFLSHLQAAKAQTSLRICAVSSEPSLLAYRRYGSRGRLRAKTRPLAPLDASGRVFNPQLHDSAFWHLWNTMYLKISWKIKHLLHWSKCSIFHISKIIQNFIKFSCFFFFNVV